MDGPDIADAGMCSPPRGGMRAEEKSVAGLCQVRKSENERCRPGVDEKSTRLHIIRQNTFSFHNICLIASQRPTATRVAGFQAWKSLGRFVRRGEKGIAILAPIVRRHSDAAD